MYFFSGDELKWKFNSDSSVNGWGWRFTVYPVIGGGGSRVEWAGDDRSVVCRPCVEVVMCLLEACLALAPHHSLITRLAAALASCAQLASLGKLLSDNRSSL